MKGEGDGLTEGKTFMSSILGVGCGSVIAERAHAGQVKAPAAK